MVPFMRGTLGQTLSQVNTTGLIRRSQVVHRVNSCWQAVCEEISPNQSV
jgi:hypothetical protein